MKTIDYTKSFEKNLKTVKQYKGYKEKKLKDYISTLANGLKLPDAARDHSLSKASPKNLQGCRNFHLAPNICVIYEISESTLLLRWIGSHNKLGLTEWVREKLTLSI